MSNIKLPFCIILAAGHSKRLGRPKSLIDINGEYLIKYIVNKLSKFHLEIIIITNTELFDEINKSFQSVKVIINKNPELGRTGSLKLGLNYLEEKLLTDSRVIVVPIDRPGFSDATLSKLINIKYTSCPAKDGKGGHPLILSREDISKVINSKSETPLREIVIPKKFVVDDEYLHLNVDTENDVKILLKYLKNIN
ncbi:MAG: molybdenum cofactor cytidylyltransferase [Candidatus Thalassarchaeaceae archaeon]|jgi:molybdenum cofactor cytidylyltransferase